MILWNDIYSWPKEQHECDEGLIPSVCSAVTMYMDELRCDSTDAMTRCRQLAFQYEQICQQVSHQLRDDCSNTSNVQRMADAYPLFLSGGALWFCASPRYEVATPEMDKMRTVCSRPIPTVAIDGKFEEDCYSLYRACSVFEDNILNKK